VAEFFVPVCVDGTNKGNNKKGFWNSYVKDWTKLTPEQQSKCRAFFQNLTATVILSILDKAVAVTDAAELHDASKVNER
jgi:hypothetical protein